jgi:phage-related tail protein
MMDLGINNQCLDIFEKMSINLAHFKEMLKLTQQFESKSLDNEVELYNEILEKRQDLINEIDQINQEVNMIKNKINQKIGLENINLESVRPYISKDLHENLTNLHVFTQNVIMKIQDLDREYNYNAELVKEATKLHLLRAQSILRPHRSYQKVHVPEARFIDKER